MKLITRRNGVRFIIFFLRKIVNYEKISLYITILLMNHRCLAMFFTHCVSNSVAMNNVSPFP